MVGSVPVWLEWLLIYVGVIKRSSPDFVVVRIQNAPVVGIVIQAGIGVFQCDVDVTYPILTGYCRYYDLNRSGECAGSGEKGGKYYQDAGATQCCHERSIGRDR